MLFVESKVSDQRVDGPARLQLLERLQDRGLFPLIRTARLHAYELTLVGSDRVAEMERAVAARAGMEDDAPYVRGDIFCAEDFALFLIFGDEVNDGLTSPLRAGIVYEAETISPRGTLDAFCRNITEALESIRRTTDGDVLVEEDTGWRTREPRATLEFDGFTDVRTSDASELTKDARADRIHAVELLEDASARRFLWRIRESHATSRASELQFEEGAEAASEAMVKRLSDAGLLRREVVISCRKVGRSLFRLPSPDALTIITASNAICSECGSNLADEKVDELIVPTDTASMLLEDGSWLSIRLYSMLRSLGVPETLVAVGPSSIDGEAQMMANVCNESFLFFLRDGDFTSAHARRALEKQLETAATHLVVVATGKVQDEARMRLREHARRRARGGSDGEVILLEGVQTAATELQHAFDRVSHRALAEELCALDSGLGLSVGHMIATRFRLMQRSGALSDLAESAVGALAGSLREI